MDSSRCLFDARLGASSRKVHQTVGQLDGPHDADRAVARRSGDDHSGPRIGHGVDCRREIDGSKPAELAVAEVQFADLSAFPQMPIRPVSAIADLPFGQLKIAGNSIGVSTSRVSGAVLTYIRLPAPMRVLIVRDAQVVSSATPSTGLLVHDGVVVPRPMVGVRSLLMQLVEPKPLAKTAEVNGLGAVIRTRSRAPASLVPLRSPQRPVPAALARFSFPVRS